MEVTFWSFAVMATSIVIDFSRSRVLSRTAKKYNSQALEADALHFETDVWSSAVVIVGLVCVKLGDGAVARMAARRRRGGRARRLGAGDLGVLATGAAHDRCADGFGAGRHGRTHPGRGSAGPGRAGLPPHTHAILGAGAVHRPARAGGRQQTLFEAHALTETIEGVIQAIVPEADVTVHPEPS